MQHDIYNDIATRTEGDIYIGVVGPVRTGKSTFIKQFMEKFVIPNIESDFRRERAVDELPQSAAGKTIMTTEPKFIPEEAVQVALEDGAKFNVRMIDCVGYIIPSAIGYFENEMPRMVVTPWFDAEVPFNMAAEVGTQKVITEHSTIGLVVTTDGSITDLPRDEYEECEERVISELEDVMIKAHEIEDIQELATYYHDVVFATMGELRASADEIETLVGEKYWPYPTYGKLLFYV